MNNFDWLRLGGLIARKWPTIDFAEVNIEKIDPAFQVYRIPVVDEDTNFEFAEGDVPEEIKFECEEIQLEKAIVEGHSVRVGYGPKAKLLLIGMTRFNRLTPFREGETK